MRNARGYLVLPRRHQAFVLALFKLGAQAVLLEHGEGRERDAAPAAAAASPPHPAPPSAPPPPPADSARVRWEYMCYIAAKRAQPSASELLEAPFFDLLQQPLQPLRDNLESSLYEIFEQDPVKHERRAPRAARPLSAAACLIVSRRVP